MLVVSDISTQHKIPSLNRHARNDKYFHVLNLLEALCSKASDLRRGWIPGDKKVIENLWLGATSFKNDTLSLAFREIAIGMGKLIDLKASFLRSSEESFEENGDEFFVWDGDGLTKLPAGIPVVPDAPVVAIHSAPVKKNEKA